MSVLAYILEELFSEPYFFILAVFMLKCLTVSFYLNVLYFIIRGVKKFSRGKIGAKAGYYIWYALLLAFPLSGLEYNKLITLPILETSFDPLGIQSPVWDICCVFVTVWGLTVLYRIENQIITNVRLERAIRLMKDCKDTDGLKSRAAGALGLRPDRIAMAAADCVRSPASGGVFKQVILLPFDYKNRYTKDELYILLLHEMAHFKNGDIAKLYFISFLRSLFFIPSNLIAEFKRDSEILCDSKVVAVEGVGKQAYGELLIREYSKEGAEIRGLAFSDSFQIVKERIFALGKFTNEKRGYAVLAGAVFILLSGSFVWSLFVPAGWYAASHSAKPPEHNIFITFEGEDRVSTHMEFLLPTQEGIIPEKFNGRPGKEYFTGAYEFLDSETLRVDVIEMNKRINALEQKGRKVGSVTFLNLGYIMTVNRPYVFQFTLPENYFKPAYESMGYQTIRWPMKTAGFMEDFYMLMSHWF